MTDKRPLPVAATLPRSSRADRRRLGAAHARCCHRLGRPSACSAVRCYPAATPVALPAGAQFAHVPVFVEFSLPLARSWRVIKNQMPPIVGHRRPLSGAAARGGAPTERIFFSSLRSERGKRGRWPHLVVDGLLQERRSAASAQRSRAWGGVGGSHTGGSQGSQGGSHTSLHGGLLPLGEGSQGGSQGHSAASARSDARSMRVLPRDGGPYRQSVILPA